MTCFVRLPFPGILPEPGSFFRRIQQEQWGLRRWAALLPGGVAQWLLQARTAYFWCDMTRWCSFVKHQRFVDFVWLGHQYSTSVSCERSVVSDWLFVASAG